jgi:hypothetical protein
MTVTATKIDSSHESGKNVITWAWPAVLNEIFHKDGHGSLGGAAAEKSTGGLNPTGNRILVNSARRRRQFTC